MEGRNVAVIPACNFFLESQKFLVLGRLHIKTRKAFPGFLRVVTRKPIHFSMGIMRNLHVFTRKMRNLPST